MSRCKLESKKNIKIKRKYETILIDNKRKAEAKNLKTQHIQRYEKWTKFFRHNKILQDDQKKLYQEIENETINVKEIPTIEKLKTFLVNKKSYNKKAKWIENIKDTYKNNEP